MNKPRLSAIIPISLALLLIFPLLALAQEEITITTYYPSPHGVYQSLRLYPTDIFGPGDCNSEDDVGKMYFDVNTNQIMVCADSGDGFTYIWGEGAGDSLWTSYESGLDTVIHPKDNTADTHIWTLGGIGLGSPAFATQLVVGETNVYQQGDNFSTIYRRIGGPTVFAAGLDSNAAISLTDTGNVGIGTTTPAYKLDVAGDVRTTGIFYGSGSGLTNLNASQLTLGTVPDARISPTYWQRRVSGSCSAGNAIRVINQDGSVVCEAAGGNGGGGVTRIIAGENITISPVGGTGDVTINSTASGGGELTGSGTSGYAARWTGVTSLGNSIIYDNGFVGIGNTNPQERLHVSGRARLGADPVNNMDAATKGYVDSKTDNRSYKFFLGWGGTAHGCVIRTEHPDLLVVERHCLRIVSGNLELSIWTVNCPNSTYCETGPCPEGWLTSGCGGGCWLP